MFEEYPKTRTQLPHRFAKIHASHYKLNRRGGSPATSLSQQMEAWMHRQVARDVRADHSPRTTLEVGAGTLNQLPYEPEVGPYDIVEPFTELYTGSALFPRIRTTFTTIEDVPLTQRYDRITSIATYEHVCDLPAMVARSGLLLSPGGLLRTSVPSEGEPLWQIGWKLTTGIEFRLRYGLNYATFLAHEHVNTARDIERVLRHFFRDVECRVFGISRAWSLYQFFACRDPDLAQCRHYGIAR